MYLLVKNKKGYVAAVFSMAFLLSGCFKDLTQIKPSFSSDFESGNSGAITIYGFPNGNFGTVDQRYFSFNGSQLLGRFNSNNVQVSLANLPEHQALKVEFDLYIHDKWQNDMWKLNIDGKDELITGFSNDPSVPQSYPNWLGNGSPGGTAGRNAQTTDLPGTCSLANSPHGSSMYRIVRIIAHTNSNVLVSCSDAGNFFNDTCQRSWSLDNYTISVIRN